MKADDGVMASKRLIPLQTEAEELTKILVTMVKKVKDPEHPMCVHS